MYTFLLFLLTFGLGECINSIFMYAITHVNDVHAFQGHVLWASVCLITSMIYLSFRE